jgi:hypothetical protein
MFSVISYVIAWRVGSHSSGNLINTGFYDIIKVLVLHNYCSWHKVVKYFTNQSHILGVTTTWLVKVAGAARATCPQNPSFKMGFMWRRHKNTWKEASVVGWTEIKSHHIKKMLCIFDALSVSPVSNSSLCRWQKALAAFSQSVSSVATVRLTWWVKTRLLPSCLIKCGSQTSSSWPHVMQFIYLFLAHLINMSIF